jgi:ornithine cyclodeaminase/alanine dehydrogenase-like protein (mu-crystallin family)
MQGRYQLAALSEVLGISCVNVFDINAESAQNYAMEMTAKYAFQVKSANSPQQAIEDADVVITATPSTRPYVLSEWIHDGVHINAIGADTPGKQELDASIIPRAKVVVDNLSQCVERGEIQTAIRQGLLKKENVYAELSDLVLGRKPGRITDREITMFDATGMAVQDITTACTVYNLAMKQGVGTAVELA